MKMNVDKIISSVCVCFVFIIHVYSEYFDSVTNSAYKRNN